MAPIWRPSPGAIRRTNWQNWEFPAGTVEVSSSGRVQPRRWRKDINVVSDIVAFLQLFPPASLKKEPEDITLLDAIQAGSRRADVAHVLDNDHSTYWEPELAGEGDELASRAWFIVDLGRYVLARKIVLRFVEEGKGDPFLLFDVLVADGATPTRNLEKLVYRTVLRTLHPNKTQRLFEIDLQGMDQEVEAMGARFVQVVVRGSDFDRGRELDNQDDYNELPAAERGATEYIKRLLGGGEVAVERDIYEQLSADQKGPIRYYRRERPRLAGLEVWGEGDEILNRTLERGGSMTPTSFGLAAFTDGIRDNGRQINYGAQDLELFFDLGALFWIDSYRIVFGRRGGGFKEYNVDLSDGSRAPDGSLRWTTTVSHDDAGGNNFDGKRFSPLKARFFRIFLPGAGGRASDTLVSEFQLYGEGFQPEVTLESDLIRLGGSRNLLEIEWDEEVPPGTRVVLQTRTGNELGNTFRYFKKDGTEVSETEYDKLISVFKGAIDTLEAPGSDWSDWSELYRNPAGSPIISPSPREFLKIRATLISEDPDTSAALRSIRLNFAPPVAQSLVGEIVPFQVDTLGAERPFSLYIRPEFERRDPGFDQLLLVAPPDMELNFMTLYGGRERDFFGAEVGDMSDLQLDATRIPTGSDSLHLQFPEIGFGEGIEVVRLDFRTALFATGAPLRASVQNRAQSNEVWQRVDAGDALDQVQGNTTTLVGSIQSKELLSDVAVKPPVFSPNGDGINDRALFVFNVVRVGDDSPVEVDIYDLGGRWVRGLVERRGVSTGAYEIPWDGRNAVGKLVPPGIYYARLRIDTTTEGADVTGKEVLRTVAVAY